MICDRCPATGFQNGDALVAHFVEHHSMSLVKARASAAGVVATNGTGNGHAPASHGHVCECGKTVACDYQSIAQLRHQAMLLKLLASKWEARKLGTLGKGRRARQDWTDDEARALVASGMSLNAVGHLFGASHSTIKRALVAGKA